MKKNQNEFKVLRINTFETEPWILKKHYAKRMPSISFAFGLYENQKLIGICTYGMPASPFLCFGVCGEEHKDHVLELNRLCLETDKKNAASFLIANSMKFLPKPTIVVSYADKGQNHVGYVYQATNFLFTGTTKERTDIASAEGNHSRHHSGDKSKRVDRSAKHRYVYFVANKKQKKELLRKLNYPVLPYPKGDSKKYDAGGEVQTQDLLFV